MWSEQTLAAKVAVSDGQTAYVRRGIFSRNCASLLACLLIALAGMQRKFVAEVLAL